MKKSAGIVLYKTAGRQLEIFLVHPGGPFWRKKDLGAWSIPKGEFTDEDPLIAAIREFEEETGKRMQGDFLELSPAKQNSGKIIYAWALEGDLDASTVVSNEFEMEWPPKTGRYARFPEVDKAAWFAADEALQKIIPGQSAFIHELTERIAL